MKKSVGTQSVAHVVYPDNPQILGPLQINKDKYLLGENVYVIYKRSSDHKIKAQFCFSHQEEYYLMKWDLMEKLEIFKKNILNHRY